MIRAGLAIGILASIVLAGPAAAAEQRKPAPPRDEYSERKPLDESSERKPLDLRAPDITKLYTREQIDRMLAKQLDKDIEEVEVEGERGRREPVTPRVWPGLAAPIWALLHPTQAWRILMPLPPDQTRGMESGPPDATTGFLEPAAPPRR